MMGYAVTLIIFHLSPARSLELDLFSQGQTFTTTDIHASIATEQFL